MRRKITETLNEWAFSGRKTAMMISGSRQVGKTYIIKEFGNEHFKDNFLTINFQDDPDDCKIFEGSLKAEDIYMKISAIYRDFKVIPGRTMIFLDEIQNCPNARTALKPLALDGRCRIVASGSLLGIRLNEVGLHPTGYMESKVLYPMDFEEFLWALDMSQDVIEVVKQSILNREPIDEILFSTFNQLFNRYMVVGGMPKAVQTFVDTKMLTGLDGVASEVYGGFINDINKYAKGTAKNLAPACLNSIPVMLACENKKFMYSKVSESEDLESGEIYIESPDDRCIRSKGTGFRYFAPALNWLDMAHITLYCYNVSEPVSPLEERVIPHMFKLYMMDTGVLISRYDKSVFEAVFFGDGDANMGAIAENAVAQAFASQGRKLMYFSKDDPRMEVDFLTVIGGKVYGVEVKTGSNRRCASLNKIMKDYGTGGLMFETRNIFTDDKGVLHLPLFACAFMDAVDPRPEVVVDLSIVDRLNKMYAR